MVAETRHQFATMSSAFDGKLDSFAEKLLAQLSSAKKRDHQGMDVTHEGAGPLGWSCVEGSCLFSAVFVLGSSLGLFSSGTFKFSLHCASVATWRAPDINFCCLAYIRTHRTCVERVLCVGGGLQETASQRSSALPQPPTPCDRLAIFLANLTSPQPPTGHGSVVASADVRLGSGDLSTSETGNHNSLLNAGVSSEDQAAFVSRDKVEVGATGCQYLGAPEDLGDPEARGSGTHMSQSHVGALSASQLAVVRRSGGNHGCVETLPPHSPLGMPRKPVADTRRWRFQRLSTKQVGLLQGALTEHNRRAGQQNRHVIYLTCNGQKDPLCVQPVGNVAPPATTTGHALACSVCGRVSPTFEKLKFMKVLCPGQEVPKNVKRHFSSCDRPLDGSCSSACFVDDSLASSGKRVSRVVTLARELKSALDSCEMRSIYTDSNAMQSLDALHASFAHLKDVAHAGGFSFATLNVGGLGNKLDGLSELGVDCISLQEVGIHRSRIPKYARAARLQNASMSFGATPDARIDRIGRTFTQRQLGLGMFASNTCSVAKCNSQRQTFGACPRTNYGLSGPLSNTFGGLSMSDT
eukprot:6466705-Amphidinium_carterae.2